jgi:hypothetical protein
VPYNLTYLVLTHTLIFNNFKKQDVSVVIGCDFFFYLSD